MALHVFTYDITVDTDDVSKTDDELREAIGGSGVADDIELIGCVNSETDEDATSEADG